MGVELAARGDHKLTTLPIGAACQPASVPALRTALPVRGVARVCGRGVWEAALICLCSFGSSSGYPHHPKKNMALHLIPAPPAQGSSESAYVLAMC